MKAVKIISIILTTVLLLGLTCTLIFAEDNDAAETDAAEVLADVAEVEETEANEGGSTNVKAIAAAAIVGVVATAGAVSMAIAVKKSVDGTARQPEAGGDIRTSMMMGLVFIETAIIYALIVAILIIFVL